MKVWLALTCVAMVGACSEAPDTLTVPTDGQVVRILMPSMEGQDWFAPGLECNDRPGDRDITIYSDSRDQDYQARLRERIEAYNVRLPEQTRRESCKGGGTIAPPLKPPTEK